jgi:toxin HigB-1
MEISYRDRTLRKYRENSKELQRIYGPEQAREIIKRLGEFMAATSLHDISKLPQARLHLLKGEYFECYAVDLKHPYRMIIKPLNGNQSDLKTITKIEIIKITDYH